MADVRDGLSRQAGAAPLQKTSPGRRVLLFLVVIYTPTSVTEVPPHRCRRHICTDCVTDAAPSPEGSHPLSSRPQTRRLTEFQFNNYS